MKGSGTVSPLAFVAIHHPLPLPEKEGAQDAPSAQRGRIALCRALRCGRRRNLRCAGLVPHALKGSRAGSGPGRARQDAGAGCLRQLWEGSWAPLSGTFGAARVKAPGRRRCRRHRTTGPFRRSSARVRSAGGTHRTRRAPRSDQRQAQRRLRCAWSRGAGRAATGTPTLRTEGCAGGLEGTGVSREQAPRRLVPQDWPCLEWRRGCRSPPYKRAARSMPNRGGPAA